MLIRDDAPQQRLAQQAEREMAAFLGAVAEMFGREHTQRAAETWLKVMCSMTWPNDNHQRFFSQVTIVAASQFSRWIVRNDFAALCAVRPF